MKMEEIESFVRKLCAEGDLSILTKKLIRTQYQAHYNKATVTREEKDKINEVLETVIQELADQSKDLPMSAVGGEFANSSPLDQGKENLHTDYTCLSSTASPPTGTPHKVAYRTARADMGVANLSHKHLIQVSLNENTISHSSKSSRVRFRSSSTGNNELPRQLRTSPRKRTSSDSVSGNNTQESMSARGASDDIDGDGVSGSEVREFGQEGMGSSVGVDVSGKKRSPVKDGQDKHLHNGRNGQSEGDCSDEVILLPMDSDSSATSDTVKSPPKWRKARMDKMKAVEKSEVSASDARTGSKPSTKSRHQKKTRRMYSVQSVLSAILESDDSTNCGLPNVPEEEEDELSSSPGDRSSGCVPHSGDPWHTIASCRSKARDSGKRKRQGLQENSMLRCSQRQGAGHLNAKSCLNGPVDLKSDDSQNVLSSPVGGVSDRQTMSRQATKQCDDSSSIPATDSDNILNSGFSVKKFFTKKVKHVVPKSKVKKPRRPQIESDSDLSCDSSTSPVRTGDSVNPASSKTVPTQIVADCDVLLSEVKEPLVNGRVNGNSRTVHCCKSVSGKLKRTAQQQVVSNASSSEKMFPMTELCKRTESTTKKRFAGKMERKEPETDDSDSDDLPLSCLRQKAKIPDADQKTVCGNRSASIGKSQKNAKGKCKDWTLKNKQAKTNDFSVSFSPPASKVVKKACKVGQRTKQAVLVRGKRDITAKKKRVTESLESGKEDARWCDRSDEEGSPLGPDSYGSIPVSMDEIHIFSLSDSTEGEQVLRHQFQHTDKVRVSHPAGKLRTVTPHEKSEYSLSESTEEDAVNGQNQSPFRLCLKKKANVKKGKKNILNPPRNETSLNKLMDDSEGINTTEEVRRNERIAETVETEIWEASEGGDCEEPWSAVAYCGEPLMFPVLQLEDIQQRKPAPPTKCRQETVSSKTERNIFEALEASGGIGENLSDNAECSKPPKVRICISELKEEESRRFVSPAVSEVVDTLPPANLDESRTVLKKQRTVKKITPQLRTTLKLRKQVSPLQASVSPDVEEWAVVSQVSDFNAGHRKKAQSEDDTTDSPRPKRRSPKAKKRKASAVTVSSDDEDNLPLIKRGRASSVQKSQESDHTDRDCEEDTPVKVKKPKKRKLRIQIDSSDEDDDLPLKSKSSSIDEDDTAKDSDGEDFEVRTMSETEADQDPSPNVKAKKGKAKQQISSSNDDDDNDDDLPLKPRSASSTKKSEKSCSDQNGMEQSKDNSTPLKKKASLKAPKLVFVSSDDGLSPMKVRLKPSRDSESDLDTTSLSSEDEDELQPEPAKPQGQGPRIKFTMKKVQPTEKKAKGKTRKKVNLEGTEGEESSYLKRLRLICRKVGIFVRNDVHFAGCTSDRQKVERLKEALKKAGMKGQPSLSKVDSVNLRREAEALDTTNIIESSGRPKRQPKGLFHPASPKKSLSPIKQQFSRIKDLISDSDSD